MQPDPFGPAQLPPDNALHLTIEIHVPFAALASWPPETVYAFMEGVSRCLSAHHQAQGKR